MMAIFGAVAGMMDQRVALGSQLGAATCGEVGAVCTLLFGCCDGLTCVTSAINTSYGICVPGDGGMVSTGTTLISPFSETAVEDVTALMPATSSAPATDPQAEREAHILDVRARRDATRTEQRTRLDARRTRRQTRKQEKKTTQLEPSDAAEVTPKPNLEFELLKSGGSTGTETLTVRNLGNASVLLVNIESVLDPDHPSATNRTLNPGRQFHYYSGIPGDTDDPDGQIWTSQLICSGTEAGFSVTVGANADSVNEQYVVLCDGPPLVRVNEPSSAAPQHKSKRSHHRHKKKKR